MAAGASERGNPFNRVKAAPAKGLFSTSSQSLKSHRDRNNAAGLIQPGFAPFLAHVSHFLAHLLHLIADSVPGRQDRPGSSVRQVRMDAG